ncbi:hypothetical protein D2T33_10475 [Sinirhodobacter populi]|uniref:Capsular biosynthesis protein n=2 Tax=Paenirhodobacter populi TaxID=2306993 RepID=A0A443IVJ8_9RHOB|nr:hypothetical protein D2T33_10475 [Sinirhodobacter populi]
MRMTLTDRKVIFLQGPSSLFFAHVARSCRKRGAETLRIGFAPGDHLYWPRSAGRYLAWRGTPADYPADLRRLLERERPTDLVMLGDGRPYHRMTLELLRGLGTQAPTPWIVEHGYLRPGLILVETWGMGGMSQIPAAFRASGALEAGQGAPGAAFPGSFARYAALDVGYHLANLCAGPLLYPHYRPYAEDGPIREYAGWIGKGLALPRRRAAATRAAARIAAHRGPVFLFPLQLAGDYQIRNYGTGEPLSVILRRVMDSFAAHAPSDALLVVRQHPLDNGLARWGRQVAQAGLGDRVVFQDGGSSAPVMARAAGVVTVNSTMGLEAILKGLPCHVLGRAIYALPGLVSEGTLEAFWSAPRAPDAGRVKAFEAFLRRNYHVPGSFDGPGALVGAENLADRLALPPPPVFPHDEMERECLPS